MIDLAICGIGGKMGTVVYNTAKHNKNISAIYGVDAYLNECLNIDCPLFDSFEKIDKNVDVIIDFSRPQALGTILSYAVKNKIGVVLATTGYSEADLIEIKRASKHIPVFMSANFSLGVNLIASLCKAAAITLGGDYDIEIIEKHHNQKVDAPSGTALMLANEINSVFNNGKKYVNGREGASAKRSSSEIGIHAVRGGTIIGEHEVIFTANDETITITHTAQSKQIFANGAVRAAIFLAKKSAGMFSMDDIIK